MSDDANEQADKKIIIDEDWKSQVEAEKEELERKQQEQEASKPAAEAEGEASEPAPEAEAEADLPLPPPSLEFLASSLGMQAMIAMGLVPSPLTGKPEVHLHQAKHFIDTIAMLEEKTEGNRTPEETAVISNLLHELRMGYLAVQQQQAES
jgi:hypothetical protein